MTLNVAFFVRGEARPAGSKNSYVPTDKKGNPYRRKDGGIVVSTVDASGEKGKGWRSDVRDAASNVYTGEPVGKVPLEFIAVFVVARPKKHYRGDNPTRGLRPDAPAFPLKNPDVLKMARAMEDALQGVLYAEDNCIVWEKLHKVYGNRVGAHVRVREIADIHEAVREARAATLAPNGLEIEEVQTPKEVERALFPARAPA